MATPGGTHAKVAATVLAPPGSRGELLPSMGGVSNHPNGWVSNWISVGVSGYPKEWAVGRLCAESSRERSGDLNTRAKA